MVLILMARHDYQAFRTYHRALAESSVKQVRHEIELLLTEQKRTLRVYITQSHELVAHAYLNPDSPAVETIRDDLRKFFPGFITFDVTGPGGELVIDTFHESVGELCKADIGTFLKLGNQNIVIHPGPMRRHIDLMVPWDIPGSGETGVFFMSLDTEILANLARKISVPGHGLYVVRSDDKGLIEFSEAGERIQIEKNVRLSPQQLGRIEASEKIPFTRWAVVDVPDTALFSDYGSMLWMRVITQISLFIVVAMIMMYLGFREHRRREDMEHRLIDARVQAEAASRAKSEFLSHMSHELRTPLNSILGFGQLLQRHENLSKEEADSVDMIVHAGDHLLVLVNDLLDLSRIESGNVDMTMQSISLEDVLLDAITWVLPSSERRSISLDLKMNGQEHAHVRADPNRLRQVVLNLLSNALKYQADGGSVVVQVHRVKDFNMRINVTDQGPGIPEHKLGRLFTAFDRLDMEGGTIPGSGIGLVITKRLIELMGGSIGVDSKAGSGSTFWIELAVAD